MPRRSGNDDAVHRLLHANEGIASHSELMTSGMPKSTVMSRIGPSGPWQRLLPGVVLDHRGTPTERERLLGALKYGGPDSVITGYSALRRQGLRAPVRPRIHLLIPHSSQRSSHHFVVVERTRQLPDPVGVQGLRLAPIPRAVIDACRRDEVFDDVRHAIAQAVQTERCRPSDLHDALRLAASQRTALTNAALREIDAGVHSVAEAEARRIVGQSTLPPMWWNVSLYTPGGEFIASPDGWYDDLGVALQIDSMEWHLSPAMYKRTQRVLRAFATHGVLTLSVAPSDVSAQPGQLIRDLEALRREAAQRPRPDVIVVRRDDPAA